MATITDSSTQKKESSSIVPVAAIIGSLSTVLIVIITSARNIFDPYVFNSIVASFSAVIVGLIIYNFVAKPLAPIVAEKRRKTHLEATAERILPELAELMDRFVETASPRYLDGIFQAMQFFSVPTPQDQQMAMLMGRIGFLTNSYQLVVDYPISELQRDVLRSVKVGGKYALLSHFSADLFQLLRVLEYTFVNSYFEACKTIGVDSVPEKSREAYAKFVVKYNGFVLSYVDFARRANKQLGSKVFIDTFQNAAPLKV